MDKSHAITRRAALLGALTSAVALAVPAVAAVHPGIAAAPPDPVLAAMKATKALYRQFSAAYDAMCEAEFAFGKVAGHRPMALIAWRDYSAIGGSELADRRDLFLSHPGADRDVILAEYHDAEARLAQKVRDGLAWDRKAGLASMRRDVDRLRREVSRSEWLAARTMPTTSAGAGALLALVVHEMNEGLEADWHLTAIKTVTNALRAGGLV